MKHKLNHWQKIIFFTSFFINVYSCPFVLWFSSVNMQQRAHSIRWNSGTILASLIWVFETVVDTVVCHISLFGFEMCCASCFFWSCGQQNINSFSFYQFRSSLFMMQWLISPSISMIRHIIPLKWNSTSQVKFKSFKIFNDSKYNYFGSFT